MGKASDGYLCSDHESQKDLDVTSDDWTERGREGGKEGRRRERRREWWEAS